MPSLSFWDTKDCRRGSYERVFWFRQGGAFLSQSSATKPFYLYLSSPTAEVKSWRRRYDVDLTAGDIVVQYVQRHRKERWWREWQVTEEDKEAYGPAKPGVPPWMERHK